MKYYIYTYLSDETLNRGPDSLWSLKIPGCPSKKSVTPASWTNLPIGFWLSWPPNHPHIYWLVRARSHENAYLTYYLYALSWDRVIYYSIYIYIYISVILEKWDKTGCEIENIKPCTQTNEITFMYLICTKLLSYALIQPQNVLFF